ncbi:hypothetical protein [Actinophytocola gossypii]|uniref:Uncharacterized protein n=1 Tax=Actinophytocola gossypii TaxID=2812003 RepID=A0ABT2J2K5_9PSEU|nr:hypothetical protein [Actinophytocola gossypii]MCT2581529.1 hypothetical protein [Actinophytocola gossypii]
MSITEANFPTPLLALRTSDEAEIRRVRGFAVEQARAATAALPRLSAGLRTGTPYRERVGALLETHLGLVRWRHELACRTPRRLGHGIPLDASRFATGMAEGGPNYDRIGYLGRLREGADWDPATRTFRGGRDTPAHRIMLEYGRIACARFAAEEPDSDTLRNMVTLPDGTRVIGNRLLRGAAADGAAARLVARLTRRGADTSRIETGGAPMYVVTADDGARLRLFGAAVDLIACAPPGDVPAWQAARYLLYQAPMTKKGSDAVTRVFLVAVGAVLFGRAPVLEHDVDLRCLVAGQSAATAMPGDPVPG